MEKQEPSSMELLNNRILEALEKTQHTHVALLNFRTMEMAQNLQSRCGKVAEVVVLVEKTAESHYRFENLVFGDQIPTDDDTIRHHGTCEIVTIATVTARYVGVVLCSSRGFRRRISKIIKHDVVWETVDKGISNLKEMNAQEAAKRESGAQPA